MPTTQRPLALLTGGTSGIGAAIAESLASRYDLALSFEKDEARAGKLADSLRKDARVELFAGKLEGYASAKTLHDSVKAAFARDPAVLVHGAGRINDHLFLQAPFETQQGLIEQQLLSGMALAQLCLPGMYRASHGRIVFVSSISAHFARRGQTGYAAAKAGIEAFARTLALEVAGRGITVNCVAPGLIETPLTEKIVNGLRAAEKHQIREAVPAGFIGEPRHVAPLVRFLCGNDAAYITGAVIPVDGGRSLGDSRS